MPGIPLISIVDDDDAHRSSLENLIRSVGLQAQGFSSAEAFLNSNHHETRCLVLDVRMPGMSGLELLTYLSARSMAVPVIVVTGHADVALAVRAMKQGAVDFLEKPFHADDLIGAIRNALDSAKASQSNGANPQGAHARLATLSVRETEVLEIIDAAKLRAEGALA